MSVASIFTNGKFQPLGKDFKPIPNGTLSVTYHSTGANATIYRDSNMTVTQTNPVKLDSYGMADVYLPGSQEYDIILKDSNGRIIWSLIQFVPPTGSGSFTVVGTITDLQALDPSYSTYAYVSDSKRGGIFIWDSSSSTTEDQGTIFESTVSVTGRWKRQWDGQIAKVEWFGALGDGSTDDYTAITNAFSSDYPISFGNKTYKTSKVLKVEKDKNIYFNDTVIGVVNSSLQANFSIGTYGDAFYSILMFGKTSWKTATGSTLSVATAYGDNSITLGAGQGSNFSIGDNIFILGADSSFTADDANYRTHYIGKITNISGDVLYLDKPIKWVFAIGVSVDKYSGYSINTTGKLTIDFPTDSVYELHGLVMIGADNCLIEDINIDNAYYSGVAIIQSQNIKIEKGNLKVGKVPSAASTVIWSALRILSSDFIEYNGYLSAWNYGLYVGVVADSTGYISENLRFNGDTYKYNTGLSDTAYAVDILGYIYYYRGEIINGLYLRGAKGKIESKNIFNKNNPGVYFDFIQSTDFDLSNCRITSSGDTAVVFSGNTNATANGTLNFRGTYLETTYATGQAFYVRNDAINSTIRNIDLSGAYLSVVSGQKHFTVTYNTAGHLFTNLNVDNIKWNGDLYIGGVEADRKQGIIYSGTATITGGGTRTDHVDASTIFPLTYSSLYYNLMGLGTIRDGGANIVMDVVKQYVHFTASDASETLGSGVSYTATISYFLI